jgi:hypothetical protein
MPRRSGDHRAPGCRVDYCLSTDRTWPRPAAQVIDDVRRLAFGDVLMTQRLSKFMAVGAVAGLRAEVHIAPTTSREKFARSAW